MILQTLAVVDQTRTILITTLLQRASLRHRTESDTLGDRKRRWHVPVSSRDPFPRRIRPTLWPRSTFRAKFTVQTSSHMFGQLQTIGTVVLGMGLRFHNTNCSFASIYLTPFSKAKSDWNLHLLESSTKRLCGDLDPIRKKIQ